MKATELMIGDWVSCDGKCYQIAELGGMVCLDAEKEIFASLEDIAPIPTTPEILEKNGFTKEYGAAWNIYRFSAPWFALYKKEFGFMLSVGSYEIPIKYVHELQHALKLCGIEKEVIL